MPSSQSEGGPIEIWLEAATCLHFVESRAVAHGCHIRSSTKVAYRQNLARSWSVATTVLGPS